MGAIAERLAYSAGEIEELSGERYLPMILTGMISQTAWDGHIGDRDGLLCME